jgi:hypothetical protein
MLRRLLPVLLVASIAASSAAPQSEPVTRFREVTGYSLFITVKSNDDMKAADSDDSLREKLDESFVARIDLTERHFDDDGVQWDGDGTAEQVLEEVRKETHFGGNFVQETTGKGRGRSKTHAALYINERRKTFNVSINTEYIPASLTGYKNDFGQTETISGDTSLITTGLRWLTEEYPLPDSGLDLNVDKPYPKEQCGTYLESLDWLQVHKEHPHLGRVHAELVPIGNDEPDLIVEADGYRDWLPRGQEGVDNGLPGATLPITARVVSRTGGTLEAEWIRFELKQVTREPGVCINAPREPAKNEPPDLSFEPVVGSAIVSGPERLVAQTSGGRVSSSAVVAASFDFGAYAVLEVTARVNGKTLTGHMAGEPRGTPITLPKCTGSSRVADAWRATAGIGDEMDDSDAETDPVREAIPGDGLTLYEEYRGLVAKIGHIRLDPRRKELMLDDRIEAMAASSPAVDAAAVQGTLLFQNATGIQVRWLKPEGHKDRVVNFNHGSATHRKSDQHALVLKPAGLDDLARRQPGEAARCVYTRNAPHPSPSLVDHLAVFTDMTGAQPAVDADLRPVTLDTVAWSVAHELLHAVGVKHHGAGDRSGVVWEQQSPPWVVKENGAPIDLRLENEPAGLQPYAIEQFRQTRLAGVFPEGPIAVAVQGGERSGDQRCLMRYAGAPAYEPAGGNSRKRVFVLPEERDTPGTGLCTSGNGTGVNAHDRPGGLPSRYGDSSNGGCGQQIRVTDIENTPAR